jgi:hypothetical protein
MGQLIISFGFGIAKSDKTYNNGPKYDLPNGQFDKWWRSVGTIMNNSAGNEWGSECDIMQAVRYNLFLD